MNVKAMIKIEVPDWQIGSPVSLHFKDTMSIHGVCEKDSSFTWIPTTCHTETDETKGEISVMDCTMPEVDEEILVTIRIGDKYYVEKTTALKDEDGWYTDDGYDWIDDIVAWASLPDPYKQEV